MRFAGILKWPLDCEAVTHLEENIPIAERALSACTDEYREQADIWKTLEAKAQVAITVAGVFLAAVFTFSRDSGLDLWIRLFLGMTLLSLLSALLCALWVLKVEDFSLPFDGSEALKKANELLNATGPERIPGSRYQEFILSLTDGFGEVLTGIHAVNARKQARLGYAYRLLKVAAISATVAATIELVSHVI